MMRIRIPAAMAVLLRSHGRSYSPAVLCSVVVVRMSSAKSVIEGGGQFRSTVNYRMLIELFITPALGRPHREEACLVTAAQVGWRCGKVPAYLLQPCSSACKTG